MTAEPSSTAATTLPVAASRRARGRGRREIRPALLLGSVMVGGAVVLAWASADARPVVLPLVTMLAIATFYVAIAIHRDHRVPVFEVGSMFVVVVTVYGSVPLVNYLAGGLSWGLDSDSRLVQHASGPAETGAFAWNYVALLGAFAVVYLIVRGRTGPLPRAIRPPSRNIVVAVVVVTIGLIIYFWLMARLFGLSYARGYTDQEGAAEGSLPLIVLQVSHNLYGLLGVEKQLLLIILISRWQSARNRFLLTILLGYEFLIVVTRFGARTELALLLLTVIVLYDRLVRPLSLKLAVIAVSFALIAIIAYGVIRDMKVTGSERASMVSSTNEFQALFGTAFDLHKRREDGLLHDVPWQIYASDFYLVIPSQLLPFEKIDPAIWYLNVLENHSSGFMFGVVAQAAVGFGWRELLLRGALLGFIFALIHRWYVRHHGSFWATAAYVFLIAWTYYSFRATTFYWVYFVLYRFIPAIITTWFIAWLVGTPWRGRERLGVTK